MSITVIKRNGSTENFEIDKIETHVLMSCEGLPNVSSGLLLAEVFRQCHNGMTTESIQNLIITTAAERISLELANGPVTPEADEILKNKGVTVVPDVLANAGGVTVSYFEWVQNVSGFYWTEEEVYNKLRPIMQEAFQETFMIAEKKNVTLREGSFLLAVKRLGEAMKDRGRIS